MFDSSDDPACFSISSKDYRTKSRLKEYWEKRSRGYNLTTLLELHNSEKYEHLVNSLVPRGRRAKICDIGTSCGFMAIVAARMGREVSNVNICISFQYQTWEKQNISVMTLITDNRRGFIKV